MNPSMQIILDCHGERIEKRHMYLLISCLECLLGVEKAGNAFWVTRTDLRADYEHRVVDVNLISMSQPARIGDEARHEPTFDLYMQGEIVPIGRLVNVAIPKETR